MLVHSVDGLKPLTKPLGLGGRDEMNLAEFPIALVTDRIPKDQREAVYQDEIFDERTGRTMARKLTIQAGNNGLTTAVDDEVILALIQITKAKNGFSDKKVEFTRFELISMLGWPNAGSSYERIGLALDRWTSVYLKYENAWRDNRTKTWTSPQGFHIIDTYKLNDSRTSGDQLELMSSYIIWNEVIFDSFQAGYLKPLDYDLCMGLRNSTAKRMYRFLDKRFHHKPDWTFDLKELAHDHIGMGRHYEGPAHLKRNLQPAIDELESVGFLEPMANAERFQKEGKDWKVRLVQKLSSPKILADEQPSPPPEAPDQAVPLAAELTKRGITAKAAADLVNGYPAPFIFGKIEQFDWEMTQPKPPKKPAGYLVRSIRDGYAADPNFVSAAQRQKIDEEIRAKQQQEAAANRQKQQQEAEERVKVERDKAYWASLTPEQQAELQAKADAAAEPEPLSDGKGALNRSLRSLGQHIRRNDYLRRLLDSQESTQTSL